MEFVLVHCVFADKLFMGMIDRYKKKGGYIQLLTLIETSSKQKQEQFLGLVAQESKVWEEAIRKRILTLDRILTWEASFLAEVFTRIQPLTLATVMQGMEQTTIDRALACMSAGDKRKIMTLISERSPTPAEKATCVMKVVSEVRGYCLGGVIKLEKADPEIAIEENIEELLHQKEIETPKETELVFDKPNAEGSVALNFDGPSAGKHSSEEVDFLKRKVNLLTQENNTLKHDVNVLRGKLDQIKKIA